MAVWYSRFELTVMVIIVQSCCLRQHKASFRSTHRPWRNNTADIKKEAQILVELNKTATHPPVMNHQRRTLLLTCRGICFYLGSASLGGVLMTALCSHEDSLHQIKKINTLAVDTHAFLCTAAKCQRDAAQDTDCPTDPGGGCCSRVISTPTVSIVLLSAQSQSVPYNL